MKIAIGICERVNGTCSTRGCFRAFNNKTAHFEQYKEQDVELNNFFTCQICSSGSTEWMNKMADNLVAQEVGALHMSCCLLKCKAGRKEEIAEIFMSKNIKIVEGTH